MQLRTSSTPVSLVTHRRYAACQTADRESTHHAGRHDEVAQMFSSLFGAGTRAAMLKGGLEENSRTQQAIAGRIARATQASASDFGAALAGAEGTAAQTAGAEVDLQQEMVNLADVQLRYEASAKLLQEAYGQLRTAIRSNG
jgi:flagellar hook-associated protein FlgK